MAARGCGHLVVFSASEEKLLTVPEPPGEYFTSIKGGSRYVAIMSGEYGIRLGGIQLEQIALYDLQSREHVASVKVGKINAAYALSAEGLLAVVDGDEVKLYQPD